MFFKKFLLALLPLLLFFLWPRSALAQTEFLTDVQVEYRINESGSALVTHTFTLENASSNLYATSYKLILDNIDPQDAKASENGKALRLEKATQRDTSTLTVFFDEAVAGKGKVRTFSISFSDNSFATRTGEVWEISIPRLSSDNPFRSYRVKLLVPVSFGNEAYLSPQPVSRTKEGKFLLYNFDKESIEKTGITVGFGAFQIFSFTLNYHLENPLSKGSTVEIALPPDTALQRVYYQDISPKPDNVSVDQDGNWIALYDLKARERVDIQAKGTVQIFATVRPFPKPSRQALDDNLKETEFWQTSAPEIKQLAQRLQTPREIYDFVSQNLSYDYDRVRPNVERLGALKALANPNQAICMEFTDLFIALARSAGVPAREINGYAYTENPQIQPLSLVADVLHSWPEYWSEGDKSWVAVDPTWASTTGGVDYFSKLDLRHFTFVIHGKDATKPYPPGSYKLGSNPQKDVFISFGQLPETRTSHPEISVATSKFMPFSSSKMTVTLKNSGPIALYELAPQVLFDNQLHSKSAIEVLPPYANSTFTIKVPFSFLGRATPDTVTIVAADRQLTVPTFKNQVIIYNLLVLFFLFAFVMLVIFLRFKKIKLEELKARIVKMIARFKNAKKSPDQ